MLTPATDLDVRYENPKYYFDQSVYQARVYDGCGRPDPQAELQFGPNIADWPAMQPLADNLLLCVASLITDPVTTTDELIPSGETSSYRSNPLRLAQFTLSRKDPAYVGRAKAVQALEQARLDGAEITDDALLAAFAAARTIDGSATLANTGVGSVVYAVRPGDGSAREQAASCQKVLGTFANIAKEYATKRYRSNLINWGMLPFLCEQTPFAVGQYLFVPGVRAAVEQAQAEIQAYAIDGGRVTPFTLRLAGLTDDERKIILAGCLINYYRDGN